MVVEAVKRFEIVNSYKDISPLFQDLLTNCTALGFEFAAFGGIEGEKTVMEETGCPLIAGSYPREWVQRYVEKAYHEIDPVVYLAPASDTTMDWKAVSTLNTDFFNEASTFGLRAGLTIPIHVSQRLYVVSFATARDTLIEADTRSILERMAFRFLQDYMHADQHAAKRDREQEKNTKILEMALSGFSSGDIAYALGMTEHHVSRHLQDAVKQHHAPALIQESDRKSAGLITIFT
ncbi:hypothetical protein HEQ62_05320 [Haematospirillum jordaniae]|uniref:autoinducer binding domain-containing protein n=1 Tax=Haematospirillum jordaniae TaxID=1549855 RepID=UPI00143325F2|nr:autoinducer binding domain-containing protein [Haematospirillum jordaniae]NKD44608.1 hypothetical protein [Haematospirillum jordaniae]NKD57628.1 hypothetical protein [Haematospirillum jordaniae]NKD59198.1 hypothetical protein [Haematospirillum jordaniae]NKD67336.1 hypothetical protein [Haematospirillum jordaniae]NKD79523.1 hypothetical protein [Haematospirillum jordaniae]